VMHPTWSVAEVTLFKVFAHIHIHLQQSESPGPHVWLPSAKTVQ